VLCCKCLGSCRSNKVCLSLILQECILQHLKIEYIDILVNLFPS
jgi:hypothetical protein